MKLLFHGCWGLRVKIKFWVLLRFYCDNLIYVFALLGWKKFNFKMLCDNRAISFNTSLK